MVDAREARRAANRAQRTAPSSRLGGTPADTSAAAQAIQDALLRRLTAAEKLAQVARLSRMVDLLSIEGLRQRHPTADDALIRHCRAELRLGRELAARVYAVRRGIA
jgi:ParB-like chromosome segregation protein Spo0J